MDVRIYACPFRTGWIYCDVGVQGERVRSVHSSAAEAYQQFQHLDQPGATIQVDVAGTSLKALREKYRP
ncbi:hypothetical protein [Nodosilinea sp. E11]|uniref:hypothetical protein n=1 Tax=Nodosilinea sp. E11 TaxID=3037479 RepID=UPI0029345BCE|nr:hypothetical protein [Nodosilinea sp. E11]WOD39296.1 hypothetical protein RRF56_24110 [Nodosilinea sp. E11]